MIPEWIIRNLCLYGNCYLYAHENKYSKSDIEKKLGKKLNKRPAKVTTGIVLEVIK